MLQFTISIDQYDLFGYIIRKISQEEDMSVHGHQQVINWICVHTEVVAHHMYCHVAGDSDTTGVTAHMISCVTSQTRCSHTPEGLDLVGI